MTRYQLRGNIVSDAHLAALAIEHGLEVCSNDSDFARFSEVRLDQPGPLIDRALSVGRVP
jgi:predicted nucleic acid-binding protein